VRMVVADVLLISRPAHLADESVFGTLYTSCWAQSCRLSMQGKYNAAIDEEKLPGGCINKRRLPVCKQPNNG
jgi:hypothetical protein